MKPVRCIARRGEQGDCWRACIATILNLDAKSVPNFVHLGGDDKEKYITLTREWLACRGLALFEMQCSDEYTLESLLNWRSETSVDVPVIVVGESKNDNHAVIAMNGKVVHDPSSVGLTGPVRCACSDPACQRRYWWLFVIAFGANSELKKCAKS